MYSLVKISAVPKGICKQWVDVNPQTTTVSQLLALYNKVWLTLHPPQSTSLVYYDLDKARPLYTTSDLSCADWLASIGSTALDTTNDTSSFNKALATATYVSSTQQDFQMLTCSDGFSTSQSLSDSAKPNLLLKKLNVDYGLLKASCLVSVNGLYHQVDTDGVTGLLVKSGFLSMRKVGQFNYGLLSFAGVGELTHVSLTQENLSKQNVSSRYWDDCVCDTGVSLDNKTVLVCIGGYLMTPADATYQQVTSTAVRLNLSAMKLYEKYYDCRDRIDLSSLLGVTQNVIDKSVFESDENMLALMGLDQSFIAVVDAPLFINKYGLGKTGVQGVYQTYRKPKYPVVCDLGRMPDYVSRLESDMYSILLDPSVHLDLTHTPDLVYPSPIQSQKTLNTSAYFVEIGTGQ